MKQTSVVERGIKDTVIIRDKLDKQQKRVFNKIKRSLMKTFINPNHGVKMLIDVAAMEYLRYIDGLLATKGETKARVAASITSVLNELDLTPKSKKATEVTKTLSQIFQTLADEAPRPEDIKEDDNA